MKSGRNRDAKGKGNTGTEKWEESKSLNEVHRRALEKTDEEAELKRHSGDSENTDTQGNQEWQQLDKKERDTLDSRRGGYPKNVYKKGKEK